MKTQLTIPVGHHDHIQGPIDASVVLLEYGDFECPACGATYPILKALRETLGDRLCFAFRHFPLTNLHRHAEHAAEAAEAAGKQGAFWQMHDLLYENQGALEDEDLAEYATALGIDSSRLISEVIDDLHSKRIREDFISGIRSGVNGTPTLFVNSARYDGPHDFDSIIAALANAGGRRTT